jgi:hypothetical protein
MGRTVGVVTGQSIEAYRGGDTVRMLKVELLGDFPETVEWFDIAGEDTAPVNGDKVIILEVANNYKIAVATKDLIVAAVNAGERKFYSRDSGGNIQATIYLKDDGDLALNDGSNHSVQYEALLAEFNALKDDYNAHKHAGVTTGGGTSGTTDTPNTSDITTTKIDSIKVP